MAGTLACQACQRVLARPGWRKAADLGMDWGGRDGLVPVAIFGQLVRLAPVILNGGTPARRPALAPGERAYNAQNYFGRTASAESFKD